MAYVESIIAYNLGTWVNMAFWKVLIRLHLIATFKKLSLSGPLFLYLCLLNTVYSAYKFCRWLDLNRGSQVFEATALPTAPQPLNEFNGYFQIKESTLYTIYHRNLRLWSRRVFIRLGTGKSNHFSLRCLLIQQLIISNLLFRTENADVLQTAPCQIHLVPIQQPQRFQQHQSPQQ